MTALRYGALLLCTVVAAIAPRLARCQTYVDIPEPPPPDDIQPGFNYFAAEQITADDNLFRLPSGPLAATIAPGVASLSDHVEDTALGASLHSVTDLQNLVLDLRLARDTYSRNTDLDNTSGNGSLVWNWGLSSKWSGEVQATFSRAIVNFATTREFDRDLLDTGSYLASARFQLDPMWALTAKVQNADTTHSLDTAAAQDSHVTSGSFGLQYATSEKDTLELQYRYARAEFPNDVATGPGSIQGNFRESTTLLLLELEPSDRTTLSANAGYLQQSYSDAALSPYTGDIWHASFKYAPADKTAIVLAASRDLSAYVGAASEYFVDQGQSITASWSATAAITASAVFSWDDQAYLPGATQVAAGTGETYTEREDHVHDQRIAITYIPRDWLEVDLSYRWEQRHSNEALYAYDDRLVVAGIKFTL